MASNDKHIDWHSAVALGKSYGNSVYATSLDTMIQAIPWAHTFIPAWENATEPTPIPQPLKQ